MEKKTHNATSLNLWNDARFRKMRSSSSFGVFVILIVLCVILAFITGRFVQPDNLFSVIRAFSYIAIMAIGECIVIITGGIDLSVGSVFGIAGVVCAYAMRRWGLNIPLSILIAIGVGLGFGLFNGFMITKVGLPAFIATLGTLSVARGLAYAITGGYTIAEFSEAFNFIGQGYIGPVP
ncbi:MAG: ABC transporter permease, partial [Clostridia bacterium]|nr:ABC transporter permease [Clostridia bacterium]